MLTFEAKLKNGKRSEIRFHTDDRGYVGELCVRGKCEMVLQSKEAVDEKTAWNLAKMVFEETYGDRLDGMRRKDE
jgi:hypothetical protein